MSCGLFCQFDAAVCLAALTGGAALAYFAARVPAYVRLMETIAGVLLVVGLAWLGTKLQLFR